MKRKPVQGDDSAERLALDVLGWLVADEDRLFPFLNATGLTPETLRASAGEPGFLAGVLDHVVGDENVLTACAGALGISPEAIATAWRRLGPPEPEDF
ncbi:DUF3572 domain-containing protein [Methylobacterium planeticum]|uniref:DUF3572 domain-containing protein n=1 Tax=Methylobacterium planeticum TaxID=2615211 RepID=A0A6N6MNS5_9HYPH|nr:DUF3572 domain-containing protein [Methylobacterium planeticum]KAB1071617.1 DUF3572 domain-containing protein [Methylobacterium planeticum]